MVVGWHIAADEEGAADRIVSGAVAVTGADSAGLIRLRRRRRLIGLASTGDMAARLDPLQVELDHSPARHALERRQPVTISALAEETRWPAVAARAGVLCVASMLCVPLRIADRDLGTLNLYAGTRDAFRDVDSEQVAVFASHAALALGAQAERADLARAVQTRDRIGQAKGILMARHQLTAAQAFSRLVAASQAANLKLGDVADWLVDELETTPTANRHDGRLRNSPDIGGPAGAHRTIHHHGR